MSGKKIIIADMDKLQKLKAENEKLKALLFEVDCRIAWEGVGFGNDFADRVDEALNCGPKFAGSNKNKKISLEITIPARDSGQASNDLMLIAVAVREGDLTSLPSSLQMGKDAISAQMLFSD